MQPILLFRVNSFQVNWFQVILIIIFGLLLVQIIRRATRKKNHEEQAVLDAWHRDPANWKAQIFYYNPHDKRIFPPKRIAGLGWTVNFANPVSVLAMLALIIAALFIASLLK